MSKTCVQHTVQSTWTTEVEHVGYAELGRPKPTQRSVSVSTADTPDAGYCSSAYSLTVGGLREYGEWLVSVADSLAPPPKKRRRLRSGK